MEELSHVYNLPEGLTSPAFSKQSLQVFFKWLMHRGGRKRAWVAKLVTKHWIGFMSGRAKVAAGWVPREPWGLPLPGILRLSVYSLPLKQNCSAPWAVRMHSIATECTLCVCVSAWRAQGCGNNPLSCAKEKMIHFSCGWQWPLCQCTSWPVQYFSFSCSRMGMHLVAKSGFSGAALVNSNKELWCGCTWKTLVWNQAERTCSALGTVQQNQVQT